MEEVARNLYLNGKLADVLERFRAEDLPVVLLKGMALVATVYEDGGLRPMCDMDVLVQPGDVTRAGDLLASLGYWPLNNDTFVDSDRVTVFDVHKDIRTAYDMGGLWERAPSAALARGRTAAWRTGPCARGPSRPPGRELLTKVPKPWLRPSRPPL